MNYCDYILIFQRNLKILSNDIRTKDEYLLQLASSISTKKMPKLFYVVGAKKTINFILLASVEMILLLYQTATETVSRRTLTEFKRKD
jgi:hypothetical protein